MRERGWSAESILAAQLERTFREAAFFIRVPLGHLALVHPEAAVCSSKEEFLLPHLETLRALIRLGIEHVPAEVDRLANEYPEVGRALAKKAAAG